MNTNGSALNWGKGFRLDFDMNTGLSKTVASTKRYLSQMRGMFADDAATERMIAQGDALVYEFYELGAPEKPGDLAFGTSITYPGKVGSEYFMTKGHFHTIMDTAETYLCLSGYGLMLLENPEGDWSVQEMKPGIAAYVPPRYAHRSINVGDTPFVTFFTFRGDAGHDYGTIETKGYRKLIVEAAGKYEIIDNPKWKQEAAMKILITPTSFLSQENTEARKMIEQYADGTVYNPQKRPLNPEEILALLDGVDGYIAGLDYITRDVILNAPDSLKVISRYGAGIDRVDIGAAKERGIRVTNTPGTNSTAVCELAFALMLSLARSIPALDSAVKSGKWPRVSGIELKGKTLGVIGFGAIGKKLAVRSRAFEMDVIAYDPYFDAAFAESAQVRQGTLEDIITNADFISLHIPLNDETRYIISKERIETMKDGVFIINTARGGLIDEKAAAKAIESGKIGGLGLDAFEAEPVIQSPLAGFKQVIMTPHTGAHTSEAVAAMGIMAVQNLIDVLEGRGCTHIIKQ